MRLIDADELSKWISGQIKSPSCPKNESAFGLRIMKHVDRMPSVQTEIIHCKDCKHKGTKNCVANAWTTIFGVTVKDDFYCGLAERRTDERSNYVIKENKKRV